MRNKIAGYVTKLMRRIGRSQSVRGISLKLQEAERERRMDFVPDVSAIALETIHVDVDTNNMLKDLCIDFPNVQVQSANFNRNNRGPRRPRTDRKD